MGGDERGDRLDEQADPNLSETMREIRNRLSIAQESEFFGTLSFDVHLKDGICDRIVVTHRLSKVITAR
jgi:hypothetical protein